MSLKLYNKKLEDKIASQIKFGYSGTDKGAVIAETDLQFTIISLRLVNNRKKISKSYF